MSSINTANKTQYSKILSTLFCSNAMVALSMLCLLNNLSLDMYTVFALVKVVVPASFCFWFLGHVIGSILDKYDSSITKVTKQDEEKAYAIPSMFAGAPSEGVDSELE